MRKLPVSVGSCFVLDDYRPNLLDSRYTGYVAKKDIKGVVLNK